MLWDVFCQVIDNFGDIGVCWRLACDLGARGHQVRLWVDDASALSWMAPQLQWLPHGQRAADPPLRTGHGQPGVTVHDWHAATQGTGVPEPGDVVVEAFGCNPPDAFVARMQRPAPPQWVNLEYLSAEDYVERSHGLHSPVWSGPGKGLSKRFFYPGFTAGTGGLLREPGLLSRQEAWLADRRHGLTWLADLGIQASPSERLLSVFCYSQAPLAGLLDLLATQEAPTRVLLTPGHATTLARAWQAKRGPTQRSGGLALSELPALPQAEFDTLLWVCDLNIVRGEDSAVRALWAGRPHVWHIYAQDDGAHAKKLDAFMARWMAHWPAGLRADVGTWWRAWNGLAPLPAALPAWRTPDAPWAQASLAARSGLLAQNDLSSQLCHFVSSSG